MMPSTHRDLAPAPLFLIHNLVDQDEEARGGDAPTTYMRHRSAIRMEALLRHPTYTL